MILSMTGYGKAEYLFSDHKTIVEIRSLNSKQLDLTLKMSSLFQKIGDNGLSMKIIRAYDSCSQMAISVDRHIAERNAQPADSLYNWIELHDPRVFADPADIDKAITAINVYLRR